MDLSEIDYRVWVGVAIFVGVVATIVLLRRRAQRRRRAVSSNTDAAGAVTLRMHMNRSNRHPSAEPLPDPPWYTGTPSFPAQRPSQSVHAPPARSVPTSTAIPPLVTAGPKEETRPMRSIDIDESAETAHTDYGSYQYENLFPPANTEDEEKPPE
ncbi:MAG: hypothetical protein KF726_09765 [Anaerolineae bacterium]|nr:hypothetical protein [Anaerolineae bacterium]